MEKLMLVADDSGACFEEVSTLVHWPWLGFELCTSVERCVERARQVKPAGVTVYAGMERAFSLMRLLRKSEDLASIPLFVVAEPEQEDLIAKHQRLPSRADRYLIRPLDRETFAKAIRELIGDAGTPADSADTQTLVTESEEPMAPDMYERVHSEMKRYKNEVGRLQADVDSLMKSTKEVGALRDENLNLKERLIQLKRSGTESEAFTELFQRLEEGYKDTIDNLNRLVDEKDTAIQQLSATAGSRRGDLGHLQKKMDELMHRNRDMAHALKVVGSELAGLDNLESEVDLAALLDRLDESTGEFDGLSATLSFDEKTVAVTDELMAQLQEID